jgi:hypothetical protein
MRTKPDQPLEEIWAIRRQIAKEFGGDPKQQAVHYRLKQRQLGARIYRPSEALNTAAEETALRETPPKKP